VLADFTNHIALITDTFYVGVILPTTVGDSVALFTNEVPPGPDGNGWEAFYDGTWGSYTDDWSGFSRGGLGNYIAVDVCGPISTGIHTISDATQAITVFPNPANDQLNVEWDINAKMDVVMYSVTGSIVKSFTIQSTALNTFDIHDLAAGTYIIRATDSQTNEQHSTLFTKL